MPIIETQACMCAMCGNVWIPNAWRSEEGMPLPLYCSKCKSARWNGANGATESKRKRPAPASAAEEGSSVRVEPETIESQSVAEVKPIVKPKVKQTKSQTKSSGKLGKCPHGFLLVDGVTACKECKIGR
jgi:hypothetical protein